MRFRFPTTSSTAARAASSLVSVIPGSFDMLRRIAYGNLKRAMLMWLAGSVVTGAMAGAAGNGAGGGAFELLSLRASKSATATREAQPSDRGGRPARTFGGL